ncbi:MAG: WbqC family protein [Verrucomicrobia bacterium]|nr:WbqC family protein [Verrucomicrobiota bacterium]
MRLAIMQPYFLPYLGYFQLIAAVDLFVVYDNIKYTKQGWINRNRMLRNGRDATFTLPLKSASDSLDVVERALAPDFHPDHLLNRFRGAYQRAPNFNRTFPLLERILRHEDTNLFRFLHHSIVSICEHLGIATEIMVSSHLSIDHRLKNQDKVLACCEVIGASTYVNAIGGVALYSKEAFRARGIDLQFLQAKPHEYPQFGDPFVPWLSIIDVIMFNDPQAIADMLNTGYTLD